MRHHHLRPAQSRRYARRCRPCPPPSRNSWATCFSRIGKKPEIGATVLICAYFSIVTSANLTMNTTVPLYTVKLQQLSSDEKLIDAWSGYDLRFEPGGKPINLVHRYGTIFNR